MEHEQATETRAVRMAKRIRRTQIVDAVSGEVLQENRETVYTSEAYVPGRGYRLYGRKHTRMGHDWGIPSDAHASHLLMYMVKGMDEQNFIPPFTDLLEETGLSRARLYKLVALLIKCGAVKRLGRRQLVVNPAIGFAGTYLSPHLYRLFKPQLSKAVPNWAKQRYELEE